MNVANSSIVMPARAGIRDFVRAQLVPLTVFFAALLPRLIDLGRRPFWLDEVFTLNRATLPPAALVHDSFINHHMPSFFLLLSPFIALGHPELWLRLPSAVFGAMSVMLVYLIGARIGGRVAGLIAALILGLSPTALAFSQEARSYTMEMALILVALYGLVGLALDIPAASRPWRNSPARNAWIAFILGSAAALDVLGDGAPWVLTANIAGLALLWQSMARRQLLWNFVRADLIIAACSVPFYVVMSHAGTESLQSGFMWIPPLNLARLWYNLGSIYFMRVADSVSFQFMEVATPLWLLWGITAALLLGVACGIWRLRRRPALLATLLLASALLPAMLAVISLWRPVLLPRYILWSGAPFAILAGIGGAMIFSLLPRRIATGALAAGAALLLVNLIPYYSAETKPRWDIAARMLSQDVAPGDVLLLDDLGALPVLKVYLPPGTEAVVLRDSDGNLAHAEQAEAAGKRVWAIFGHAGQSSAVTAEERDAYDAKLAPLGTPRQVQTAGNRIVITLFDPTSHFLTSNCTTTPPRLVVQPAPSCG